MKEAVLSGVIAILVVWFAGCGEEEGPVISSVSDDAPSLTPSEVVVAAYTAANEGKYSEVEKYIDPDSLQRLNTYSSTKKY